MRVLSPRERRIVAVGALVAAGLLTEALIVAPIVSGFSDRAAQRELLLTQYAHAEQIIATLPRLRRLARLSSQQSKRFVMSGFASPDAAGLALEERLRSGVETAGGEYRGGDHDGTTAAQIRAHGVARMPVEKLVVWLEQLGNAEPYLVVEQLEIGADAALASQKAESLEVKIEISVPFIPAHA